MTSTITKPEVARSSEARAVPQLFDDWFDPIKAGGARSGRGFIEELIRGELGAVLSPSGHGVRSKGRR